MAIPFPNKNAGTDDQPGIQNKEIEMTVLAGLLINPGQMADVIDFLTPDDFYYVRNGALFGAMKSLFADGAPVQRQTILDQLSQSGDLVKIGGRNQTGMYISEIQTLPAGGSMYTVYYARMVQNFARRRLIAKTTSELQQRVMNNDIGLEDALAELDELRSSATVHIADDDVLDIQEAIRNALLDNEAVDTEKLQSSGISYFDEHLGGGFRRGKTYYHAGRPGMGKTTAALHFAVEAARGFRDRDTNEVAVLVTIEMQTTDVINRILASNSGVPFQDIENNNLNQRQTDRLYSAVAELAELRKHLVFWNPGTLTPEQLWNKLLSIQSERQQSVGAVFVDHMHVMGAPAKDDESEYTRYSYISERFRMMRDNRDRETQVPRVNAAWHIFAQLSRSLESRTDKRPVMSDLRGTGRIEEHADVIFLYYRDAYYNEDVAEDKTMEIITGKNRRGPTGTNKVIFLGETYAIREVARQRGM